MVKLTFVFKDTKSLDRWKLQLHRDKTLGGEWIFNDDILRASKDLDLSDSANFPVELLTAFGVDYFKIEKKEFMGGVNPYGGLYRTMSRSKPIEEAINKSRKQIKKIIKAGIGKG